VNVDLGASVLFARRQEQAVSSLRAVLQRVSGRCCAYPRISAVGWRCCCWFCGSSERSESATASSACRVFVALSEWLLGLRSACASCGRHAAVQAAHTCIPYMGACVGRLRWQQQRQRCRDCRHHHHGEQQW
jgi:hypothetical protein